MKNKNIYISGNTVLAPERNVEAPIQKEEYEKLRKAGIERTNRVKQKKNAMKRSVMMGIACTFIVGFGLIWSEAQVYNTQQQLTNLKRQAVEVNKANEDLRLQLAKVGSIDHVKRVAENNLHMINPDRKMIMYADLKKDNFKKQPNDDRESITKDIISKLKILLF